jgi:MFS family permease
MAVWTLVMGLNALAPTFIFLFLTRLGVGIVEANGPAAISLLSDYYPVSDRAKRIGLYNSGALVGSALGLGLAGVFVDSWGWRAAFWMWIPFGIATVLMLVRAPEPARGDQDADFAEVLSGVEAVELAGKLELPPPSRIGTTDYENCTWQEAYREIFSIRSMWFGVVGITVSQALLSGLGFWGVPYFKEVHHLSASKAGLYVIIFGLGAAVGVVSGGFVADRFLRRGIVNARIYVVFVSSILATAAFIPGFASTNLSVTLPCFLIGGVFLTLPVAPADALLTDVVVAPLRGRAAALRSIVRSIAGITPLVIGALTGVFGLQTALLMITPLYAVGGCIMLFAARTYPADLAFVAAESQRLREQESAPPGPPAT